MQYIDRIVRSDLTKELGKGRAIVIYGPRRSGKTTLSQKLLENYNESEIIRFQTDDPTQARLFTPSVASLGRLVAGKKVVFIDEAQAIENAGLVLKLLVDSFPDVQVIATGSSSFELSDKIQESMVGRVYSVTLLPFSVDELALDGKSKALFDLERSLRFGSYPEVILSHDQQAIETLQNIRDSYLVKDALTLTEVRNPLILDQLLTALALQVGNEVSYNELATMLEVSRNTIERYLYLLEKSFVIFRLNPLSSNPRKLLASRKRKVYFYDLGIRNLLAGQLDIPLSANQQLGGIFENFCVLERLKTRLNHHLYGPMHYWRSPDSEVDYIEQSGGTTHAYEIKWNKNGTLPPRFKRQFPESKFTPITKDSFWKLLEN